MNRNQLTMTRGDDRTFTFIVDDDYATATGRFLVEDLFTKTGLTVGEDDGSGSATVSVTIDADDTEDCPDIRHPHRYELELTSGGDVTTVRRGLLIVVPDIEAG